MSVALSASRPGSARNRTFDRIGIVVRRSTTLCICPSAFRNAARSIVSFMMATQELADRRCPASGWHPQVASAPAAHPARRDGTIPRNLTASAPPFAGARSTLEHPPQQLDILRQRGIGALQLVDLADCMHDRRVVAAAKFPADLRQRTRRQLLG